MRIYDKQCTTCGTTLSKFYQTGLLGCPDCYYAFGAEVLKTVEKVQGAEIHVGKKPKYSGVDRELMEEYKKLLAEKERAGIEGRFDDMAKISRNAYELLEELKRRGLI